MKKIASLQKTKKKRTLLSRSIHFHVISKLLLVCLQAWPQIPYPWDSSKVFERERERERERAPIFLRAQVVFFKKASCFCKIVDTAHMLCLIKWKPISFYKKETALPLSLGLNLPNHLYIYIYKTEAFEASTIFHVIIFFFFNTF